MLTVLLAAMALMAWLSFSGITFRDTNADTGDVTERHYFSYRNIKQGLDLKGGVYIVFEAENPGGTEPTTEEMKESESIIRLRLDDKGYTEATVSIQGSNRLRVEIPDVEDADAAVEDIGKTAQLLFIDEDGNVILTGAEVATAAYQEYTDNEGGVQVRKPGVAVTFSREGTELFSAATARSIGRRIFIILDDIPISWPMVQQHITTSTCSITGEFTMNEANNLATLIKHGALPVPLSVIEMNRIGAQLGSEALQGGIKAAVTGTMLILLFMLIMYRVSGLTADLALVFFILSELLVLSIFRITLTLPGIAGIILTIGMAVDANVIIFERMKEELNMGKTMRTSIDSGFSRAMPAILDGSITTLIAGFVLFWLGTGPIKGFAATLMIGVILSMITSIFITRLFIYSFYKLGVNNRWLYCAKKEAK